MHTLKQTTTRSFAIDYGADLEAEIDYLQTAVLRHPQLTQQFPPRWLAIKLLERDAALQQQLLTMAGGPAVLTMAQLSLARLEAVHGEDVDTLIADRRYSWIHNLTGAVLETSQSSLLTRSDKIDRIVTHRFLGIPLFLAVMWAVFRLTADVSAPYVDWIDGVVSGPVARWVTAVLTTIGLGGGWLESLLLDGVLAGVGGVLVFVPVLMSLYLALALLEDSGYMARAAFVMDRLMSRVGLHGKSFLPLLVGFGCNVPAIYATRTLENEKDRVLTGLLVPFMSCGARLPVYVLFATIFFPRHAGLVIFSLYLLGIATAVFLGIILRRLFFQEDEASAFVMELAPYRLPAPRNIWLQMWQRTRNFLKNAATLILATSVIIWLLMAIPVTGDGRFAATDLDNSAFAQVAGGLNPLLTPLGFGTWEAGGALVTGIVAKEVVVSTLAQTYGRVEETAVTETADPPTFWGDLSEIGGSFGAATLDTLRALPLMIGIDMTGGAEEAAPSALMQTIRTNFEATSGGHGALAGLAFMVFVLLYTPCMVAVAAEKQEFGAKWMWSSLVGQFILAWFFAFIVFQGGKLLGLG